MKSLPPQLLGRIGMFGHLPTLPHILLKLIRVCSADPASMSEISRIISHDAALSARVMATVTFAGAEVPGRITTIGQAVSAVGADTVKNLVTCAALRQTLDLSVERSSCSWLKRFWEHTFSCAATARSIAQRASYHSPEEAYLSGLLHDLGKLVFRQPAAGQTNGDEAGASVNEPDLATLEQLLGATHGEVGAEMVHRWNLQSFAADAVLYHHEPVHRVLNALPLVKFVFVANKLCSEGPEDVETRFETAEQVTGLSRREVEEVMSETEKELRQAAAFFDISLVSSGVSEEIAAESDLGKQRELLRTVRDLSLVQGTLQNGLEAHDADSMLRVITQGFQALSGVRHMFLFLYNQERNVLAGYSSLDSRQNDLIRDVVIPVQREKSLIAECLLKGRPLDSLGRLEEATVSILDQEILRFMGTEGMVCLPLVARKTLVGAVVLGVGEADAASLVEEIQLLTSFADRAALLFYAERVRQIHEESTGTEALSAPSDLARKVVHEVSNPLGIIKNYLRILGPKLSEEGTGQEEIRIINEEIDRVSGILQKLSDYSKPSVHKRESIDINSLLSDLIKITHEPLLMNSNIKAHFEKEPALPAIISDKNGLKQVFINLIKNAVEAMPEGGNLHIETHSVLDGGPEGKQEHTEALPSHVEVHVRDEGHGISGSVKTSLFEPFVSSKGAGHAGLGLSIAHTIVTELDGEISCESGETRGTVFKVVLPVGNGTTD